MICKINADASTLTPWPSMNSPLNARPVDGMLTVTSRKLFTDEPLPIALESPKGWYACL
jgi:hypothetical protein